MLLSQITSKDYGDRHAVKIESSDFESGSLPLTSYVRPGRLVSIDPSLIIKSLGAITEEKRAEITAAVADVIT